MLPEMDVRVARLLAQTRTLAQLGELWLANGATSFSVWYRAGCLFALPDRTPPLSDCRAPIRVNGTVMAELRVSGVADQTSARRLATDAALLAQIVASEDDLDAMTEELVQTQDQLLALYDLTRATHRHIELASLVESIGAAAMRLIKSEQSICWVAPTFNQVIAGQYPIKFLNQEQTLQFIEHALGYPAPVLSNFDNGEASPTEASAWLIEHLRHLIFIPINVRGVLGAGLALINKTHGRFTAADLKLASAVAELAGAQIDNALLYQETLARTKLENELELAARIQLNILPHTQPDIAGLDIFGSARPASLVGGDFFDYIPRRSSELGIVIGDVAGKGMSAALLMSMMLTTIRSAMRFMPLPSPANVLRRVNQDLYAELAQLGSFVTMFIGWYDGRTRRLQYANAGHAPVIYMPVGGPPALLIADSTAMGVLEQENWQNQILDFAPGDVLIAATDGFPEARADEDTMLGYERLLQLAVELAPGSAREIGEGFYRTVHTFSRGHAQDDDQTIVVLKGIP